MATLTMGQRARVERAVRKGARRDADEARQELNVVPFLDIVMNVLMFVLATMATVFTAEIRPAQASCCGHRAAPQALTVLVTPEGYVVAAPGGRVAVGCRAFAGGAPGATVPLRAGRYDREGLTRCVASLKASTELPVALRAQRGIQVSTEGTVGYGELVGALDAVRETSPGAGDLFPDATLGMVR